MVQLAYEELVLERRAREELQQVGTQNASLEDECQQLRKAKEKAEADLATVLVDAGRRVEEAEEKAKAVVASEAARRRAEFDKRLEAALGKAKEEADLAVKEAVLAYRRDRGRAVEQTTAYIEGGVYILGKIKDAFPSQDWSQLPVPAVSEGMIDDEHTAILHEIEEEIGNSSVQQ